MPAPESASSSFSSLLRITTSLVFHTPHNKVSINVVPTIEVMSGAFEAAAGAFAVAGVADVLVRTSREICSFLGDVSDAPEEIMRLREVIRETVLIY
jgi:hypothetical protein